MKISSLELLGQLDESLFKAKGRLVTKVPLNKSSQRAGAQATSPPAAPSLTCLDGAQATRCSTPVVSQCAGAQATSPPAAPVLTCLDGAQATRCSTPIVSQCAGAEATPPPAASALTCLDGAQTAQRKPTLLEVAKALCVNAVRSALCLGDQGTLKNRLSLIRKQQKSDPFLVKLRHFVEEKELTKGQRYCNIIKRFGPSCFVKDDLLLIKLERPGRIYKNLICLPAEEIANVIASSHCSLEGGHEKDDKTAERILQVYWFPGLFSEVQKFIDECPICLRNKEKEKRSFTELQPLEQPTECWERAHCDLYGPLRSQDGSKKWILTIVDAYSKFAIFTTVPDKSTKAVADAIFDKLISVFSCPRILVSDQGKEFNSGLLNDLTKHLGIEKRLASVRHPESNSQAEIINKRLPSYLKSMTENRPLDWEINLSSCMLSYNSSVHKAIKASPFSILLGFEARTPFNNFQFNTTPFYGEKHQDELMKRLQFARNLAKKNNIEYRQTYKKYFDSKILPKQFSEGMLCWLHQPELLKVNPKICSPFFGPWVVLSLVGKTNAVIQYLANKKL